MKNEQGYTLIEILIVVAIIGVLAAIAIPAYQGSVIQGKRSVAQSALMDMANRQEQFYLNNKTYTDNLSNLGYGTVFDNGGDSAIAMNDIQVLVASGSSDRIYIIEVESADATSYVLNAIPQLDQADDTECGTFTLTNTGARTESGTGTPADCW